MWIHISLGLLAEVYPYFPVEGTPGLLEAEVIVQLLVRQVAALHREVVPPAPQRVAQREVVAELPGHHEVLVAAADGFAVVREAMQVLCVVGQRQGVAPSAQAGPREGDVVVGKAVGNVGDARAVGQVGHLRAICVKVPPRLSHRLQL